MPFSRFPFDNDRYSAGPDTQSIESFPVTKVPNLLSGTGWSYDNAIDLFSVNSMLTDTFPIDLPDLGNLKPNDFSGPLAPPPEISGFAMSSNLAEDALSHQPPSDLDSDDPLRSPTSPNFPRVQPAACMNALGQTPEEPTSQPSGQSQSTWESASTQSTCWEGQLERTSMSDRRVPRRTKEPTSSSVSSGNAAKRAAHNVIEKRYRTNMNAKFIVLEKTTCDRANKSTKSKSGSLKKSKILDNAISYVHNLQEENKALQKELLFYKQNCVPRGWRQPRRAK